jgi:mono/diheme cytochrome c family protein
MSAGSSKCNTRSKKMRSLKSLAALVVAMLLPALALGQSANSQRPSDKQNAANRGKKVYSEYCASCHGISGRGDGPAASALKIPPADLTALASHNKGVFPSLKVMQAIKAGPRVPAHGSEIMPVWGPTFLQGDRADVAAQTPPQTPAGVVEEGQQQGRHGPTVAEVQLRIYNLMEYIRSLQTR